MGNINKTIVLLIGICFTSLGVAANDFFLLTIKNSTVETITINGGSRLEDNSWCQSIEPKEKKTIRVEYGTQKDFIFKSRNKGFGTVVVTLPVKGTPGLGDNAYVNVSHFPDRLGNCAKSSNRNLGLETLFNAYDNAHEAEENNLEGTKKYLFGIS